MKYYAVFAVLPLLLTGCASLPEPLPLPPVSPLHLTHNVQKSGGDIYANVPEVVRYDRYLLVNTDPLAAQRDPLSQVIDIRIPSSLQPSVADGMRYVLQQSGYSLCTVGDASEVLYRQPLPSVHFQPGPMRLRTALQVMAGPAWELEVDDVQRVVCHNLRPGYQLPARPAAVVTTEPVDQPLIIQELPLPGGFLQR